jgi:hypothetical protein
VARQGQADEARRLCLGLRRELDSGPPFSLFVVAATYARLGDLETALDVLMECRRMRDGQLAFMLTQPSFDVLRGHPRYERLLDEMHFREVPRRDRAAPAAMIPG